MTPAAARISPRSHAPTPSTEISPLPLILSQFWPVTLHAGTAQVGPQHTGSQAIPTFQGTKCALRGRNRPSSGSGASAPTSSGHAQARRTAPKARTIRPRPVGTHARARAAAPFRRHRLCAMKERVSPGCADERVRVAGAAAPPLIQISCPACTKPSSFFGLYGAKSR